MNRTIFYWWKKSNFSLKPKSASIVNNCGFKKWTVMFDNKFCVWNDSFEHLKVLTDDTEHCILIFIQNQVYKILLCVNTNYFRTRLEFFTSGDWAKAFCLPDLIWLIYIFSISAGNLCSLHFKTDLFTLYWNTHDVANNSETWIVRYNQLIYGGSGSHRGPPLEPGFIHPFFYFLIA